MLDMTEFLKNFVKAKAGKVLNEAGEIIGTHDGAIFHTLGSRHGFTITIKNPNEKPYFVIAKDLKKNTLTVAHKEKGTLMGKGEKILALEQINWIGGEAPSAEKTYGARVRYRAETTPCTIKGDIIEFSEKQEPLAPGQSVVIYEGEECLGGGVIR
jgi:tRNA-specific 2-thiouridylase